MENNCQSICNLCSKHEVTKCNQEEHEERGFSLSLFSNFDKQLFSKEFSDQLKSYLNTQAIIF